MIRIKRRLYNAIGGIAVRLCIWYTCREYQRSRPRYTYHQHDEHYFRQSPPSSSSSPYHARMHIQWPWTAAAARRQQRNAVAADNHRQAQIAMIHAQDEAVQQQQQQHAEDAAADLSAREQAVDAQEQQQTTSSVAVTDSVEVTQGATRTRINWLLRDAIRYRVHYDGYRCHAIDRYHHCNSNHRHAHTPYAPYRCIFFRLLIGN